MPYIKQSDREQIKGLFEMGAIPVAQTAGELNYLFTLLSLEYLNNKKESYQTYNDIMGALEGAKLELYRRKIAPYEDEKIIENGDVYD